MEEQPLLIESCERPVTPRSRGLLCKEEGLACRAPVYTVLKLSYP